MLCFTVLPESLFMLMKRVRMACMPSVLVTTNDPLGFRLLVIFGNFSICCFIVSFPTASFLHPRSLR